MIYAFLLVLVLGNMLAASEQTWNPAEVIRQNILQPGEVLKALRRFPNETLAGYHDGQHNNLMHVTVLAMLSAKHRIPVNVQFEESVKPLMRYLAQAGVKINQLNDDRKAPHFFVYEDDGVDQSDFADFLENELNAHPTYFSLEPEKRKCKRAFTRALQCIIL